MYHITLIKLSKFSKNRAFGHSEIRMTRKISRDFPGFLGVSLDFPYFPDISHAFPGFLMLILSLARASCIKFDQVFFCYHYFNTH